MSAPAMTDIERTADRFLGMLEQNKRLVRENDELRGLVTTAAPPLLELRVYDAAHQEGVGVLSAAWVLEQRGDKCHVAFKRDADGRIIGLALSVEDR